MSRVLMVAGLVALSLLAGASLAFAQTSEHELDQCLDVPDEEIGRGLPTCQFDGQGNLISRTYPDEDFGPGAPPAVDVGGFIVIALLWAGIPLVIAVAVATSRQESAGAAVALTLILGWIGLAIVVFGQRSAAEAAGRLAAPAVPAARAEAGPGDSAEERLRRLEDLHAQGLISDEERAERRGAVLDEL